MQLLKFLESIRTGVGDFFFSTITNLGDETFFLVLAITFFWCINKRQGYYILMTGVVGSVINQWLKIICRVPRPWINTGLTTVGDPISDLHATGYSFPSGHTQNIAGTFGCIGRYNKQKWIKIVSVTLIALVAFSRLYLGVHTPLDVGVSLVIAAALVFSFYYIFRTPEACEKYITYAIAGSVIFSIGFILYVFLIPEGWFKGAEDLENLVKGLGFHFRTVKLAAEDCSASMARTYDIEIQIPSMNGYKEVSSVSNARDYQARRGMIRYRRADGKVDYVHTLNGSGLATSRILPALVEQNQNADGSVNVPDVLKKYLGMDVITKPGK